MATGTAVADDVRLSVDDQLTRLASHPTVERLCGELYLNNYVIVLPRRGVSHASSAAAIGASTSRLNTADALLLDWCEELATSAANRTVLERCRQWRKHVDSGENLIGAAFAVHAFHELNQSIPLAVQLAQERPGIERVLRGIDPRVRDVCRLNGFVPLESLERSVGKLLVELARTGGISAVERIEVAQDLGEELSGPAARTPEFPTLLVYLRNEASTSQIEVVVRIFGRLTDTTAAGPMPPAQFAARLGTASTVSQGFRLFKHYLYPLGLLDTIYDRHWNYALTAPAAAPAAAHGETLRQLLTARAVKPAGVPQ